MRPSTVAVAVWAASLLLVPAGTGQGVLADLLLGAIWLALLLVPTVERPRRRDVAALVSGALLFALWSLVPGAYPTVFVFFATAVACIGNGRLIAIALVPAVLPLVLVALAWSVGNDVTRMALRADWRAPTFSFSWWSITLRFEVLIVAAYLGLRILLRDTTRSRLTQNTPWLAGVVLLVVTLGRGLTIRSLVSIPVDSGWSEPPMLLNLLRLRVGAPIYTPFSDCSSYSYAPTLELVHHAILAPFGWDLSLEANRALGLVWLFGAAAVLVLLAGGLPLRISVPVMLLAAMSSFLVPKLHPDHLLEPWFVLALFVALHRERLSKRVFLTALVLLPPLATAVKMTGAGVGLGLAFAFLWPFDRRRWLALGAGAVLSIGVLAAAERLFPRFLSYTVGLQASHPIAWSSLKLLPFESASRVFSVAVVALVAARVVPSAASRDAARDGGRVLLVTLGFALPSLVAYLKVGGRANSLLPFALGGIVILARLARVLWDSPTPARKGFVAAFATWCALAISPPMDPLSAQDAAAARSAHDRAVALLRVEIAAGRRTLFYGSTSPWIDAGERSIPLDQWQPANELVLGRHPEVESHFDRLASGYYASVVASDPVFDPTLSVLGARLHQTMLEHFEADPSEPGASVRVWRWRRP